MPRAAPIQTNFTGGEWSPPMYGRVDLPKYYNACRRFRNMVAKVQGPAYRRGGTKFVAELKTMSAVGHLIPFEFSTTQAYVLEFENNVFRIFKDNGIVESSPGVPVEVTTTYLTADLPTIQWAQSADIIYLVHASYPPRKVTRTSHVAWTITTIDFQDGPYLPVNTTAVTLTLSGTSGSVNVTASAITAINGGVGWLTTDVGRLIRWKDPANNWTWLEITARTSATVAVATVMGAAASAGTATINWRLGSWSDTTGYPTCVTFFQDRLCFGGEPSQAVDMSCTGDYENFRPSNPAGTVAADDAIQFTLNANDVNVIRWLADDEKGLIVGTVGGEWLVRASSQGEALTPDNVQATRSTTFGSAAVQPLRVDTATLFVQRAGFKLHENAYVFEADGFRSPNMTLFAEEITRSTSGGLTRLAYQQEPDRIVWAVRGDGRLVSMTYEREQEVIGWSLHTIGGVSDANGTPAKVESIAVIPSTDGSRDELWLIVQRRINGATKRYVEYMKAALTDLDEQEDAFYVDSGLTYDSTPATLISGLDHLEGQTVTILADGASHPTKVVVSGDITLERSASVVHIGLPYTSILETMNLEAGAADGTAQGKTKRSDHVVFRFYRTLGGSAGPDDDHLDEIPNITFRAPSTPMGSPPDLFTGDAEMAWPAGYEKDGRVVYQTADPFPAMVQAIMPRVVTQAK